MADSFELLRARVTIDVAGVKAASLEVAKLQASLNALSKPIKINVGTQARGERQVGADKVTKAVEAAARRETQAVERAVREQERIRRAAINRALRLTQLLQVRARDPNVDATRRAQLLAEAERRLILIRQRVAASSQEAVRAERQLTAVRRASESGVDSLTRRLRTLAIATEGAGRAPGITSFVAKLTRLVAAAFRGAALLAGMTASAAALTAGLIALVAGLVIGASLIERLAKAAFNAAVALGRAVLTASINVLSAALKAILTPIRAVYAEFSRLFSITGFKAFAISMIDVAASMEQARAQLRLAFGDAAQAEFARLRSEADLFGTSIQDLTASFSRFALAAQGTQLTLQDIRNLFTGIQAASRVNAISTDALSRIFRALEQISTKGALRSEELVQQLGDALPAATRLAAKSLGFQITETAQLIELMRKGQVEADRFLKAFGRQLLIDFFQKAVSLTDTLAVRLARIRNLATLMSESIGNVFSRTLVFGLERIIQAAIRMREAFAPIGDIVESAVKSFQKTLGTLNFEVFFNEVAELLRSSAGALKDFGKRLATVGIIFNGAALVAGLAIIRKLLIVINDLMGKFIANMEAWTGLDLSSPERAFAAIIATLDAMPAILQRLDVLWVQIKKSVRESIEAIIDTVKRGIEGWRLLAKFKSPFRTFEIDRLANKLNEIFTLPEEGAGGGLFSTLKDTMTGIFKDIADAQQKVQSLLNGPEAKKSDAAQGIEEAADKLRDALSGEKSEILDPLEWVRRLNAATFTAQIGKPEVEQQQKQVDAAQETAKNTREMLGMMRRGDKVTPLFGRIGAGLV